MRILILFLVFAAPIAACDRSNECAGGAFSSTGTECETEWTCEDGTDYRVLCNRPAMDAGWACDCEKDSVKQASFQSSEFCSLTSDERLQAANTGCNWEIETGDSNRRSAGRVRF